MAISAALVKELRERTGAGMMECKKALQAADGDIEAAAEAMRREGLAKADKKADRIAAEGRVAAVVSEDAKSAVLVEVNCETDFVGKNDDFIAFAEAVARVVLDENPADVDALGALLFGELLAQGNPPSVDISGPQARVGPREVDILKHAERPLAPGGGRMRNDAVGRQLDDFARHDVAYEGGAHRVERDALGGDNVAVG